MVCSVHISEFCILQDFTQECNIGRELASDLPLLLPCPTPSWIMTALSRTHVDQSAYSQFIYTSENIHPLTTPQGSSVGSPKKDGTRKEMHIHSGSSTEAIWEFQGIRYLESRQQLGWWISNVSGWLGWMLFLRSPLPGCLVGDLVGERNSSHCVSHAHGC